jgi:hypothetical protein
MTGKVKKRKARGVRHPQLNGSAGELAAVKPRYGGREQKDEQRNDARR